MAMTCVPSKSPERRKKGPLHILVDTSENMDPPDSLENIRWRRSPILLAKEKLFLLAWNLCNDFI